MFVIQNVAKIFSHFMKKSFDNEGSGAAWVAEHQHHGDDHCMAVPVVKSIGENVGQINKYNQHRIV